MSEKTVTLGTSGTAAAGAPRLPGLLLGGRRAALLCTALVVVFLLVFPLYVGGFWLRLGLFAMAAAVGAVGLTVLFGAAGQLSLGHAFFIAVGTYGYAFLSGEDKGGVSGLGLPPLVAAVLAVALAGVAGLLFSPVASRLRGIYLGIASLGLVFLGHHLLLNLRPVTGGYDGRSVAPFSLAGHRFTDTSTVEVLGVPFGGVEHLWYLFLVVLAVAVVVARNVLCGRPGRAYRLMRDSEVGAAAMGVNVPRAKASAFVLSSVYAGTCGVMTALAFQRAIPDYFDMHLSIDVLVMIVLGGLGSVTGALVGATFVIGLPMVLTRYAEALPLVGAAGEAGGLDASIVAQFAYGALVIAAILRQGRSLRLRRTARPDRAAGPPPAASAAA